MGILPSTSELTADVNLDIQIPPSKTYRINGNRATGVIDGIDAVKQAVGKILQTERFRYLIYSWDYGVELQGLFGKDIEYVVADLKRIFEEALLQNLHVKEIANFECEQLSSSELQVQFTVMSEYGEFEVDEEVRLKNGT